MKGLALTLLLASSTAALATQDDSDRSDKVAFEKITENFDGSFTVTSPKVYAADKWLPIISQTSGNYSPATVACLAFGFSGVRSSMTDRLVRASDPDLLADLGYTNSGRVYLKGIHNKSDEFTIISHLTCQE